jgi:hypothetical protein
LFVAYYPTHVWSKSQHGLSLPDGHHLCGITPLSKTDLAQFTDLVALNGVNSNVNDDCGTEYCSEEIYLLNDTSNPSASPPDTLKILVGLWMGVTALGLFLSWYFVDSRIPEQRSPYRMQCIKNTLHSLKAVFVNPAMLLTIPLSLFIGLATERQKKSAFRRGLPSRHYRDGPSVSYVEPLRNDRYNHAIRPDR